MQTRWRRQVADRSFSRPGDRRRGRRQRTNRIFPAAMAIAAGWSFAAQGIEPKLLPPVRDGQAAESTEFSGPLGTALGADQVDRGARDNEPIRTGQAQRRTDRLISRLPPDPENGADARQSEASDVDKDAVPPPRDIVFFAAGTIELQPPAGWQAREVPVARELRLLLTPPDAPPESAVPHDGVWLALRPDARSAAFTHNDLANYTTERLRRMRLDGVELEQPESIEFGDLVAVKQPFHYMLETASSKATPAGDERRSDAPSTHVAIVGKHLAIAAEWGVMEVHMRAPQAIASHRFQEWDRMIESLVLHPPVEQSLPLAESVHDAEPIIGSWKSYRGTMRLRGDGKIVVASDPREHLEIGDSESTPPLTVVGEFSSERDLLYVKWPDGSKLNFRWRLKGDRLLLTDHEGRMSQLRRVLE